MFKCPPKRCRLITLTTHYQTSEEKYKTRQKSKGKKNLKVVKMEEEKRSDTTVEISGLRFTYPGIDGHPPPGSKPLIEDFSLKLNSSERCLLVGSNGAGTLKFVYLC